MTKKVKLKGNAIPEAITRAIIHRAKKATTERACPYRRGWVNWSVWTTAYRYRQFTNDQIYAALIKAGVPCT